MTTEKIVSNPFGQDWLDQLRQVLPTIKRLNISDNRFLIDGNREALFIIGHKTKRSKAHIGMIKISNEGSDLKIKTTSMLIYLIWGIIAPLAILLTIWITSKSTIFSLVGTMLFIWIPYYFIRDILRQEKFSEEIKIEIETLNKKKDTEQNP